MSWRTGVVTALRDETATARTIVLDVAGWPGHEAGQHVDVRLTAPDGYSAVRSYSIASAPHRERVELTVERLADGEVSPYLTEVLSVGDSVELRGPVGGWFVWRPRQQEPLELVGGGSGVVPLMAMIRTRAQSGSRAPARLLYSVRTPESVLYRTELEQRGRADGLEVRLVYTRAVPPGSDERPRRVDADVIAAAVWPPANRPACYVCGPTPFVEAVADLLVAAGHDPRNIRTERFGPSGGSP